MEIKMRYPLSRKDRLASSPLVCKTKSRFFSILCRTLLWPPFTLSWSLCYSSYIFCTVHVLALAKLAHGLAIPVPPGKAYLNFQKHSIQALVQSNRLLLADEMGLGKTISVIGAINVLHQQHAAASSSSTTITTCQDEEQQSSAPSFSKILIVCPKSVMPNWQQELNHWLVHGDENQSDQNEDNSFNSTVKSQNRCWTIEILTAGHDIPRRQDNPSNTIFIINYDMMNKFRNSLDDEWAPFDLVVCDEAHYLKNPDAIRSKAVLGSDYKNDGGKRRKRTTITAPLATQRLWLLTGSPLLNNPTELYNLLRSIDVSHCIIPELQSQETFSDHYSNRYVAPWGVSYQGGRNLAELRHRLHHVPRLDTGTPLMIRRTKAQVLTDLPPKRHQLLPLHDEERQVAVTEYNRVQNALEMLTSRIQGRENDVPVPNKENTVKNPWAQKTVVELKAILKEHNLKVSGTKKQLITRLEQNLNRTAYDESNNNALDQSDDSVDEDSDTIGTEIDGVFDSAQSALRSQGGGGKRNIIGDILGLLRRRGMRVTGSDSDAIKGLLASARHETAKMKVPHAIELIKNVIETQKVVVFAHHRDVQEALRDAFGNKAVGIMGGDTMDMRSEAVRIFQTDPKVRVFVGSIKAAGTGITLNAASHVIFVELDWSPLVVQQAEDRCHRVGQRSSVLVQYLYFPDTIDAYLSDILAKKQSTITCAIDEITGSSSWIFTFGQFKGMSVADVAGSTPLYLEWLVQSNSVMLERIPELVAALKELGFLPTEWNQKDETILDRPKDGDETTAANPIDFDNITEGPSTWEFNFGKHEGRSVLEVAKSSPSYLEWIVQRKAYEDRPKLVLALESLGFLSKIEAREITPNLAIDDQETSEVGSFVITFGKHKGTKLQDIPTSYLEWLNSSGTIRKHPILAINVKKFLHEKRQR